MRISTVGIHTQAVNAILTAQAALSKTQQQVASGKRVATTADDPVAAVQLHALARLQAQNEQYDKNSVAVTSRLQQEESALADSTTVLQRIRDLVLQANTATTTSDDRTSIVTEIRERIGELQGIANRKDNNGDYLFAGFSATTQPFVRGTGGAVSYAGDNGTRQIQVDTAVGVPDGDSGATVFGSIKAGNGLFTTGAHAANTGNGVIDTGSIINRGAWVPDTYTVSFTAPGTWQVTDSASNVVATGAYTSGTAISFRGVQVTITGTPATGDQYDVDTAGTTDVFASLDQVLSGIAIGSNSDAARAQLNSALGGALQQLDQSLDHLSSVRAQVGSRLSLLDDLQSTRTSRLADIQTSTSQLSDLDYASAVATMNQQSVSLQAAQQSYARVARLSLFDYL